MNVTWSEQHATHCPGHKKREERGEERNILPRNKRAFNVLKQRLRQISSVSLLKMWVELLFLSLAVLIWWLWQVRSSQRHWQSLGLQVPWLKFPFGNHPFFVFDGLKKKDFQTASR